MKHPRFWLLALIAVLAGPALAADVSPQRVRAMREAAREIQQVQQLRGNDAAISVVEACHAEIEQTKASYDQDVETCLTWDFYVALSTAAFAAQMPPDWLQKNRANLQKVNDDMVRRLLGTFARFGLSDEDASLVTNLLRDNVMQATLGQAPTR
jgi:hypothetical protein